MKLNVAIFSIWLSAGMPSWVMGQGVTEAASDTVPTRYEKMMTRRMEGWKRLIPDHYKIQFAGSIGVVSIGTGWTGRSSSGRQISCWAFCLNLKVNIIRPFSL